MESPISHPFGFFPYLLSASKCHEPITYQVEFSSHFHHPLKQTLKTFHITYPTLPNAYYLIPRVVINPLENFQRHLENITSTDLDGELIADFAGEVVHYLDMGDYQEEENE